MLGQLVVGREKLSATRAEEHVRLGFNALWAVHRFHVHRELGVVVAGEVALGALSGEAARLEVVQEQQTHSLETSLAEIANELGVRTVVLVLVLAE